MDRERLLDLIAPLLVPAGLAGLGLLAARALGGLDAGQRAVAAWLPLAVFAGGWVACLRFNRTRLGFLLVSLALAYLVLVGLVPRLDPAPAHYLGTLLGVLLPFNLLVFSLWPERGALGSAHDARWVLLSTEVALTLGVGLGPQAAVTAALAWQPSATLATLSPLGLPVLGAWAAALLVSNGRLFAQPTAQRGAVFVVVVLGALVLHAPDLGRSIALLGAAALILTSAALQEGWSLAYLDTLTGLPGRRALDEALSRQHGQYAVAMLDVDHFKKFNDTHGHHVGDEVLRMVAAFLREVEGGGRPHRYGGEEFTVLFPGLGADQALPHLERLREAISDAAFELRQRDRRGPREVAAGGPTPVGASGTLGITISIGVADSDGGRRRPEAILGLADEALYAAKRGGRDQTRVHGQATAPGTAAGEPP